MPHLTIAYEKGDQEEFKILQDELVIGRSPDCDLYLKDRWASHHHAKIEKKNKEFVLSDLGSSNGTYVNRKKVKKVNLEDGDVINIGQTSITFHHPKLPDTSGIDVTLRMEIPEPKDPAEEGREIIPPPKPAAAKETSKAPAKEEQVTPFEDKKIETEKDKKEAEFDDIEGDDKEKSHQKEEPEKQKEIIIKTQEPVEEFPEEKALPIEKATAEKSPLEEEKKAEPDSEEKPLPTEGEEIEEERAVSADKGKTQPEKKEEEILEPRAPDEKIRKEEPAPIEMKTEQPDKDAPQPVDIGRDKLQDVSQIIKDSEKDLISFFRKIPIFTVYTDQELSTLLQSAELKTAAAGEILVEQGSSVNELYVVFKGRIRIIQTNDKQKEINLGVRERGDHFNETSLITGNPSGYSARAAEESKLVSINGDVFHDFLLSQPKLRDYFDKFIRYTSIHQFLKTFTDLGVASPKELKEMSRHFKAEFFNKGEAVIRQGTEPDKFYLIESGKVKVVRWEEKRPKTINFLQEGEFFGEKALFEESKRYADVICLTDCQLLSLSKEGFTEIVQKSPKIKKVFSDRIQSYMADKQDIQYTQIIKQQLSALKPITVEEPKTKEEAVITEKRKKRLKKLASFYRKQVRFPFIEQHDQMTCGTTCIMMIAKYYGKQFSSARLRDLAHVDLSGSSLANLASAAEQLGFSTRGMKIDYETLMSIHLPCIVHWKGFHYIVVYKVDEKNVWVSDPAIGNRKYKKEYFLENWKGITLTLEPTLEFEEQKEDKSSFKNFIGFVKPYKAILFEVFIASLLLNIFGLATPIFTQNIIDKVLAHENISMLNIMLIGMLIVIVFRVLTMIVRQYLIIHTGMKIDLRMLVQFYKHMLALPLGYFKVRKIGDFITRFGENLKIRNFLTETALTIVLDSILIVVYLSLMFYYNTRMTLMVLLFIPLFLIITLVFTPMLKKLNIQSFGARVEQQSHLIESINAIDTVKAMNTEYPTRWKWEDKYLKSLNIDFKLFNTGIYFNSLGEFVASISSTFILWYGAHTVLDGNMSVGELMAFMALMGSVITPINRIISTWDDIQETLVSVDRLNDVFAAKPEFSESAKQESGIVLKEPKGEIEFKEVFFRYGGEDDTYILSSIDLKIPPQARLAIVGRSGSGKTTLAKLIARFYDVTEGKITIDGHDIRHLNLANLRKLVGFVLQENFIFNGTISENISLGDPEESLEKVIAAAKLANAHDFITNLGVGYETRVGESGLQLSGGQRQRIAIARVLYSNPKIIIFDEATSSLDTESEQAIQKNLDEILQDRTAIIIAHRLSTVRNADKIIVLDNGEIIEEGNHEELMKKEGLYHYLNYQQLNI